MVIGVGGGKLLGVRSIFAQISPNLPEKFLCGVCLQISPTKIMKTFSLCGLQKKVFMCFSANVGLHFLKANKVGRHFCPDIHGVCSHFQGFRPDFQQIKTFRGALASPPTTPVVMILRYLAAFSAKWYVLVVQGH